MKDIGFVVLILAACAFFAPEKTGRWAGTVIGAAQSALFTSADCSR